MSDQTSNQTPVAGSEPSQPHAAAPEPVQPPATAAQQPVAAPAAKGTTGMGIASLVLGILALLSSFLPIINNASFFLAIIGVILGVVGIVATRSGKKSGKGIAIAGVVLGIVSAIIVLATQSLYSAALDSAMDKAAQESNIATAENTVDGNAAAEASHSQEPAAASPSSAATSEQAKEEGGEAKYTVSIDDAALAQDYSDKDAVVVTYSWTNNSDETTSFLTTFSGKVFQNGVELDTAIVQGIDSSLVMADVKPGGSTQVQMAYSIRDRSDITVEVHPWISFNDEILAERTFSLE